MLCESNKDMTEEIFKVVLILVLMEDALRVKVRILVRQQKMVLILVLMEDALRVTWIMSHMKYTLLS